MLIEQKRSIIPACDVPDLIALEEIVRATSGLSGIGAYKVGIELVIRYGLPRVVQTVRAFSGLSIIYDHQKAGNDIPALGVKFAKACKSSGVNAVILFPFAGPATERAWIKACKDEGITILVGGEMTHEAFLENEGGFISQRAGNEIYEIASECGVTDFVVPGNKPSSVAFYRELLEGLLGIGGFILYAPGFISQGGDVSETGKAAGYNWHAIVGSAIYNAGSVASMREVAQTLTSQIGE